MNFLEAFTKTMNYWISSVSNYSLAELQARPDTKSWSLGQVYYHLIEETVWYCQQIEKCFTNQMNTQEVMTEKARLMFATNEFPDIRIVGDPFISDKVPQPESVEQLVRDMEQLKADVLTLYARVKENTKGKSKHPGLGYFSASEWFQYIEMHMRHHMRQKARLDFYLGKP
ncbi:MAG: DinB family protein [Cyclobacteriaceae bacterium]|nr:DinB family protein [Cyclobacteriaceae bacterium]